MYDSTITLFNYRKAEHAWYTTVFQGVNLIEPRGNTATTQGQANADAAEIIIHANADQSATTYGEDGSEAVKQYKTPKAYAALEDVAEYFTFAPEVDFIAVGNHASAEALDDDDYDEGLYQHMNDTTDGVYMVASATWFSLLPHFEIGGR